MDKSWYIDECNRQLNDAKFYRQLDGDITDTIQQRVTVYIERMFNDGYIDEKTKKYLVQTNVTPGRFYILPKIHKTGYPGRSIVSSNSHPTERISQFVDYYINPLVSTVTGRISPIYEKYYNLMEVLCIFSMIFEMKPIFNLI